ncbi:RodZ domain-containing protein [Alteromonas flava]|uniref:RodZ domain-containing protein n=1 Tax=Alteromonas flava TaxID=2048003 RepID=UPI000C292E16|nr:RodZ domain-containing protein [Alteromonas flava]
MTENQAEQEEQQSGPSVGQQLKAAREAQGLSQQALADKLFLKLSVIEQLEADDTSQGTSPTFIKGYVRLYAKNVGLDPEPLLAELSQDANVQKTPHKLQSFSKRVSKEANDSRWMMLTYFILIVVIALFILWWYQQAETTAMELNDDPSARFVSQAGVDSSEQSDVEKSAEQLLQSQTEPESTLTESSFDDSTPAESSLDDVAPVTAGEGVFDGAEPDTAADSLGNNPVATAENVVASNTSPDTQSALEETSAEGEQVELVFTFNDDCWVNITDATGEAIAYGTKVRGRVMPISGVPPFEVTLGAPQNVAISYAGEPVDMSDIPAGRSARFSLPRQ